MTGTKRRGGVREPLNLVLLSRRIAGTETASRHRWSVEIVFIGKTDGKIDGSDAPERSAALLAADERRKMLDDAGKSAG